MSRRSMSNGWEEWLQEKFGSENDFYPVELEEFIDGDLAVPEPTMLHRSDGAALLYRGKLHWVSSEPEAGKTWLALLAVQELLEAGRRVVYFDYEMNALDIVRRLRLLGTSREALGNLDYIRPPSRMSDEVLQFYGSPTELGGGTSAPAPALFEKADLVVFDACTEAMTMDGYDPLSNTDVAAWLQRAPRLATKLGTAVLVLDHVTKDREGRGRWAIGAGHKLAQADVGYSLSNTQPFAPGTVGLSAISVTKDREGGVRERALNQRRVGTLVLNAETEGVLEAFISMPSEDEGPTRVMDEIMEAARRSKVPLSKSQLESLGGRSRGSTTRSAVTRLIASGKLMPFDEDVASGRHNVRYVAASE